MTEMNTYEKDHNALMRTGAAECTLYFKRNGDFPLDAPGQIALYGSGGRNTIKGGTGSGDVNVRSYVTVEQGLEAAGFTVTTKAWLDAYDGIRKAAHEDFIRQIKARAKAKHTLAVMEGMGAVMPEPAYDIPLKGDGDTAVYVLSRISGEGNDRSAISGDILLSETEIRDILAVQEKYDKFLLVLNVGGVVDMSPVLQVENILYLGQLGTETGGVLADILLGRSYPSGKLTTTWSAWEDYPTVGEFGDINETRYREGVYVGYRYFDAVRKKALFPFGFGLGNTDFSIQTGEIHAQGEDISVSAVVTNTGKHTGREVAQLYVSSPAGKLDKPYQALAAFAKTKELKPGQTEELMLRFKLRELASYDETTSAWLLEKGDYILRLGSSSVDTQAVAIARLDGDAVTVQVRGCFGKPDFDDWKPEGKREDITESLQIIDISAADIRREVVQYDMDNPVAPSVDTMTDSDLAYLSVGAFKPGLGALSIIGSASQTVAGAAGETSSVMKDRGVPVLVMADGPAGLRLSKDYTADAKGAHPMGQTLPDGMAELMPAPVKWFMDMNGSRVRPGTEIRHQYCTAIPIGTCLAQSWNLAFAEACGDLVGDEMERFGVHLWLAPALNIHRDIRCGRNFEYYSEDPLISGKFAAAVTRGVQRHPGCGTTIKHFAANNQETNRYRNNSQVSERALREIYLRGFGISIAESQPKALMTSYNLLNGVHTSERRDLLEDVLRCEFGFKGVVMTDWIISVGMQANGSVHGAPSAEKHVAAGNDLTMPGGKGDYKQIMNALKDGRLSVKQLKINVSRVYRLAKELAEK